MRRQTLICSALVLAWVMSFLSNQAIAQATDSSWTVPMTIKMRAHEFQLSFGVRPGAKEGFDNDVDVVAPPPPFTPYAVFSISTLPNYLEQDFRGPSGKLAWSLRILNTNGDTSRVSWNVDELPTWRTATINQSIKMKEQNSAIFVGDQTLEIIVDTAPPPKPPGNGKGCCGQSAAMSMAGLDPSIRWKVEMAFTVAFFILPILLLRRKKRE